MSSETSKAGWKASAQAAIYEIEVALRAEDTEVLMYLYNAQKEIAIAISTREEQK